MTRRARTRAGLLWLLAFIGTSLGGVPAEAGESTTPPGTTSTAAEPAGQRALLDAPLLFVKRFNYLGIHIYDTYYKWRPGGGIYVIENPSAPPEQHRVRPLIDETTPENLGGGVYSDPDVSWDGQRVLFCHKPAQGQSTSIYEIKVDGTGRRRITDPSATCSVYKGSHGGQHDVTPCYLPDGRIVFTSTRPSGLVPCANEGVAILHVVNADGSNLHPISVNNVNEFDPSVLPDGRILFGRWEYVDKTALTQQSLWTVLPDGTGETALFANNLVRPEALLDARAVPGSGHLIISAFTRHNAPPRGSLAFVDPRISKNGFEAIAPLENPDPSFDLGDSCEPWALSEDVVIFSGKPKGSQFNALYLLDRAGRRTLVHADPKIDCHSPIPLAVRQRPPAIPSTVDPQAKHGRFFVQNIYQGLDGVKPGEVKWLRVIEETSRVSATPGGAYNQTFLVSQALAFGAKNYLGVVPVEPDGSAYFEVPSGRAVYLQALDGDGRLVRSMRTFIQAPPGTTRSCMGCHEHKYSSPVNRGPRPVLAREPKRLQPESWGSGYVDFPTMVQPVLDRRCVRCHGGEEGFAGDLDLTGGWTEHFSNSYENLVSRRETQVTAHLIAAIDCMNGTARWSAQILPPRSHGSGSAPLAEILASGHDGYIPDLTRTERDLLMAWIDTNGLYHGSWDYSKHGPAIKAWNETKAALTNQMRGAGCLKCHGQNGKVGVFERDWINLKDPELSRILRAPLAKGDGGGGLTLCRSRQVDPSRKRVRLMRTGGYVHHVLPMASFAPQKPPPKTTGGEPVATFASTADARYQQMLETIRNGRRQALAAPRIDMPGAEIIPGKCRQFVTPPIPEELPALGARVDDSGLVALEWGNSATTIGLTSEIYRGDAADFEPNADTQIATTTSYRYLDKGAATGEQHYAVVLVSGSQRSTPIRATTEVPPPQPPATPAGLESTPAPGRVDLRWDADENVGVRYIVYRAETGGGKLKPVTPEPVASARYKDTTVAEGVRYSYAVRAVSRRGAESAPTATVEASALPEIKEPVFVAMLAESSDAVLLGGGAAPAKVHGGATVREGALDLSSGGFLTYDSRPEFSLERSFTLECRVKITGDRAMPVIVSCGVWNQAGWFLQRIGSGWRWHVGGVDCDGGKPVKGEWTCIVATFDGEVARLYQDGKQVAERSGSANRSPWSGRLHIGQYSGGAGDQYQVLGQMAGVRLYNRAIPPHEATALSQTER